MTNVLPFAALILLITGATPQAQEPPAVLSKVKWDYLTETISCGRVLGFGGREQSAYCAGGTAALDPAKVNQRLRVLGSDGWELVDLQISNGNFLPAGNYQGASYAVAIFKRSNRDAELVVAANKIEAAEKAVAATKDSAIKAITKELATTIAGDDNVIQAVARAVQTDRLRTIEERLAKLEATAAR